MYRIVSYRIVSYRIVSYRIVSYRIASYRIMSPYTEGRLNIAAIVWAFLGSCPKSAPALAE